MSQNELIDIIDENNIVIGVIPRSLSYERGISHRIVHVMVIDKNKIYLVQRADSVRYLPGFFCTSAGGHVLAGETSEAAALRELEEEIGLHGPLDLFREFFFEHEFKVHVSLFIKRFQSDSDRIVLNPSEVKCGNFYSKDETQDLDRRLFHPQLTPCLKMVLESGSAIAKGF